MRASSVLCVPVAVALGALSLLLALALALPMGASGEQASQPASAAAGRLDVGGDHSCAVLAAGSVRCWGFGGDGRLGYGNLETIGDYETPGSVGPADLGTGRTATALSAGGFHSCAVLDDASVRCWGSGNSGQLGYANTNDIGDNESPGSVGPVDLGLGRTAQAITAGEAHTCAILNLGSVRCWGYGSFGRLGYPGSSENIGDDETPGSVGPVEFGTERTATAISAGRGHTCALLDDRTVRCWGANGVGQLGYGNTNTVGDNESPGSAGPVDLGPDPRARAITAGASHTCAILDDASVRCWGAGSLGQLGYGNTENVGDNESPRSAGPVDLGLGRSAKAITAGDYHTCALLDNDSVRCWGWNGEGRLGYGRIEFGGLNMVGDNETPGSVGPVNLGSGRAASAISAGGRNSCARLDDGNVRCWGYGAVGSLGNCTVENVGDDEVPGSTPAVGLAPPAGGGSGCPRQAGPPASPAPKPPANTPNPPAPAAPSGGGKTINGTPGNDTLNGTPGNDVINCGDGDDVVNAGGGDDVINCGAGNDRVNGGAGNDRIDGASGNDLLSGNEDDDRIVGGSGNERANGNEGNDRVSGSSGNDRVGGQSGHDRVNGERGRDRVSGGSGNDRVGGQSGNDRVNGDSGRDRVNGGSGRDVLSGARGNDSISARDRTRDRVDCGSGRDRVTADGRRGRDRVSRSCERVRRR